MFIPAVFIVLWPRRSRDRVKITRTRYGLFATNAPAIGSSDALFGSVSQLDFFSFFLLLCMRAWIGHTVRGLGGGGGEGRYVLLQAVRIADYLRKIRKFIRNITGSQEKDILQ